MNTHPLTVRKVESRRDFKAFFEFPWAVYKGDPNWVPPLLSMRRHLLDKQRNPSWEYLTGEYFVAWRGEQPVGTIAAFVNHRHNEHHNENIGWFGCFECYDDAEAARALLETASDYVRASGCTAIRGPASFTLNDECALLIENFEPPVILMPYNHPYYQRLIEENETGFAKIMDVVSLYVDPDCYLDQNGHFPEKLERVVEKTKQRRQISTRGPDVRNLTREIALLREIYEAAWEKNWGFVPPTSREMDALFASLKQYYHPALGVFALVEGKEVGFMLGLPDMNQVLRRAYPRPGEPEVWTLLKALWHWKIRPKITRNRILLYGIKEQYRKLGADAAIYMAYLKSSMHIYPVIDAGWVLETNVGALNQMATFNAYIYKRYRFYQRPLD